MNIQNHSPGFRTVTGLEYSVAGRESVIDQGAPSRGTAVVGHIRNQTSSQGGVRRGKVRRGITTPAGNRYGRTGCPRCERCRKRRQKVSLVSVILTVVVRIQKLRAGVQALPGKRCSLRHQSSGPQGASQIDQSSACCRKTHSVPGRTPPHSCKRKSIPGHISESARASQPRRYECGASWTRTSARNGVRTEGSQDRRLPQDPL